MILASLLAAPLLGCANPYVAAPAASGQGYALLHEILGQERQVSKLLLIKEEAQALETVVDAIAETCGAAYERLELLSAETPRLDLSDTGLPAEEVRTRRAIAATRRDQLLAASGREFQLQLLLSQNEALTYMAHLADTLARHESDPARLAYVRRLWRDLTRLQEDVQALLRHPARSEAPGRSRIVASASATNGAETCSTYSPGEDDHAHMAYAGRSTASRNGG